MPLARILEPELMDTERDAVEYDAMDFVTADTAFAVDALALVRDLPSPDVLDLGTGTAKIPILMCDRRTDVRVLAVDPAQEMLRVAGRNVAKSGHTTITLARMDGKALRLPAARFDLVMCNSTLHHVHDPPPVLAEIKRVLKPGGAVLLRDLERPASMEAAWEIVKRVAAGDGMRQQQLFFDSLCASFTVAEVEAMLRAAGLSDVRVRRPSDRHWSAERHARPKKKSGSD